MPIKLSDVLRLPVAELVLLAKAWLLLLFSQPGVRLLGIKRLLALMQPGKRSSRGPATEGLTPGRLARVLELACRFQRPRPTCLLKALVLQRLLAEHGFETELVIGAGRSGERLTAHAWLEHQGRVVFGATSEQYHSLHSFTGKRDVTGATQGKT